MRIVNFIMRVAYTMAILVLLAVAAAFCSAARAEIIIGPATHVSDGDTITVQGVRVRLLGVDAPELGEPYGRKSRAAMIDIVDGETLICQLSGKSYDRRIGLCNLTSTKEDVGRMLIQQSLALDCPRYSAGLYRNDQTPAALAALTQKEYCK